MSTEITINEKQLQQRADKKKPKKKPIRPQGLPLFNEALLKCKNI